MFDLAPYISLMISIAAVVGNWMIFKKMGEPGWKALIPVYSYYIMCKKVWNIKPFIIETITGIVVIYSSIMTLNIDSNFYAICIISMFVWVITDLFVRYHLKQAFNKSGWFFAGMIFFSEIFTIILGFDPDSEYYGNPTDGMDGFKAPDEDEYQSYNPHDM